jgi:hypothetical protein
VGELLGIWIGLPARLGTGTDTAGVLAAGAEDATGGAAKRPVVQPTSRATAAARSTQPAQRRIATVVSLTTPLFPQPFDPTG